MLALEGEALVDELLRRQRPLHVSSVLGLSPRLGRDYSAGGRGPAMHRWNHVNYSIPPERMALVEACIDAVFPWEKFVTKPYLLGYRFSDDLNEGALYFRPVPEAGAFAEALH